MLTSLTLLKKTFTLVGKRALLLHKLNMLIFHVIICPLKHLICTYFQLGTVLEVLVIQRWVRVHALDVCSRMDGTGNYFSVFFQHTCCRMGKGVSERTTKSTCKSWREQDWPNVFEKTECRRMRRREWEPWWVSIGSQSFFSESSYKQQGNCRSWLRWRSQVNLRSWQGREGCEWYPIFLREHSGDPEIIAKRERDVGECQIWHWEGSFA